MVLKKGSKPVSITHPYLMEEWDFENNGEVRPEDFSYGSNRKVHWICKKEDCGYGWFASITNRTKRVRPRGCPYCSGRLPTKDNNLAVRFPELLKEWDYSKNKCKPTEVLPGSHEKMWWGCKEKHSWRAALFSRCFNGASCPYCDGRVPSETNNLAVCFPNLIDEWDSEKNDILPESLTVGSGVKVWWLCSMCGCSWETAPYYRTHLESGCPICSRGNVSPVSQKWLDSLGIDIREYVVDGLGIRVDGFDPTTNTVYEFLGDFWHGNPDIYSSEKINRVNKKSYGRLHQEWLDRKFLLEKNGYKVVYIWESDYNKE